ELLLCLTVIGIGSQLFDLRKVGDPAFAHMLGYPVCQQRVSVKKETSLGDTVGLVVELLRHHLIKVFQLASLQDLSMKTCNTVDRIAADDRQTCHMHLSV